MELKRLTIQQWQASSSAHKRSAKVFTEPFRRRRRKGKSHPVDDFLFVYYRYSSKKLEQWHPGVGIILEDAESSRFRFPASRYTADNDAVYCDTTKIGLKEFERLKWIARLLRQTESRKPNYTCFGLHEWAMVYQGDEVRHEQTTPLRLSQIEIDKVVESRPIACSHFDAFRFFAIGSKPLNRLNPTLESREDHEQPACIHANMDLYKWAFKSMPWIGSDLLFRCFQLALKARAIDMRASPYDLQQYGVYDPIKIETPEGRDEYEQLQRVITSLAEPIRNELASRIENILESVTLTA